MHMHTYIGVHRGGITPPDPIRGGIVPPPMGLELI